MANWFPVLVFDATPLLCVDCSDLDGPAPLYILDPWAGDTPESGPRWTSLSAFVTDAISLFDDGYTRPHPEQAGVVDIDRQRLPLTAAYSYW